VKYLAMGVVKFFGVSAISALALVGAAPSGLTQSAGTISGQSESGKISWELRPPVNPKTIESTLWIWSKGFPDQAVSLGEVDHFGGVHFTSDDAWILVGNGLSSGSFITAWQRKAGFRYSESNEIDIGSSIETAALTPLCRAGQKIEDLIDRDSFDFESWAPEYGKYAFVVGLSVRMSQKWPDGDFHRFGGWRGVYDLQKRAVVRILDQGKMETASEKADGELNGVYDALRGVLDEKGAEQLKIEEEAWLKQRDAIKDPAEKLSFVQERVIALDSRIRFPSPP
jgi:hypothetical protein